MAIHFKNTELAVQYNISEATVRNWIKSTKEGKLQLELAEHNGRIYVANSVVNIPIIESLVGQNRKYRNSLAMKTVQSSSSLLKIFTEAQVYDIVRNLEIYHELPRQYGYFGHGAKEWDEYINKQLSVDTPSMLHGTIELLADNLSYIDKRLTKVKKVNVIDIGVGNAVPVKNLLEHLIAQGKLGRYVALDFSDDMLSIAQRNISNWFGERVQFEGFQLDIAYERFANIIAEDYLNSVQDTVNLVLFLGATAGNLRVPSDSFRTICESMNPRDILLYTDFIEEADKPPEWFVHSYDLKPQKPEILSRHRFVLDQLNIEKSFYDAEIGYDKTNRRKYSRARLRFALTLQFELSEGERIVQFEKGDTITLWHSWQPTLHSLFHLLESTGFYVLHSSQSEDHNYILTIAEVRRD